MKKITCLISAFCFAMSATNAQTITTIAGNGSPGYSGDHFAATAATINHPEELVQDRAGNVYFVELENSVVRKISTSGIISTIVGTGTAGFNGDGIAATAAQLNRPYGVAIDTFGNFYIGDASNNRVRKVNTAGIISTIAGTGTPGYTGDGFAATAATLHQPMFLRADAAGNIYFSDNSNFAIRKISNTGIITTVIGTGATGSSPDGTLATAAQISASQGLCVDTAGNLFFCDVYNNLVRKVDHITGILTTIAGNWTSGYTGDNGQATAASLNTPNDVFADATGDVYIADCLNHVIRKINPSGIITTIAGSTQGYSGDNGPATIAQLNGPTGIHIGLAGKLYITDATNQRIRVVTSPVSSTNVANVLLQSAVELYPNPAQDVLNIVSSDNINSLSVYNLLGQNVYSEKYDAKNIALNIAHFPKGIYTICVNNMVSRTFVKN